MVFPRDYLKGLKKKKEKKKKEDGKSAFSFVLI